MERGPNVEKCESSDESSDGKTDDEDACCLSHTSPPHPLPRSNQFMQNSKGIAGTACIGLEQPQMDSGKPVTGRNKVQHRKENKSKRRIKQVAAKLPQATMGYHIGPSTKVCTTYLLPRRQPHHMLVKCVRQMLHWITRQEISSCNTHKKDVPSKLESRGHEK